VSSNTAGQVIIKRFSADPDSSGAGLWIQTTEGDDTLNLADCSNVSNVYATKLGLDNGFTSKLDHVWNNYWALRVSYVGPLLDRSGVAYVLNSEDGDAPVDIAKASFHPHSFVTRVDDRYIYLRSKE